jgi:hypothetical protein
MSYLLTVEYRFLFDALINRQIVKVCVDAGARSGGMGTSTMKLADTFEVRWLEFRFDSYEDALKAQQGLCDTKIKNLWSQIDSLEEMS